MSMKSSRKFLKELETLITYQETILSVDADLKKKRAQLVRRLEAFFEPEQLKQHTLEELYPTLGETDKKEFDRLKDQLITLSENMMPSERDWLIELISTMKAEYHSRCQSQFIPIDWVEGIQKNKYRVNNRGEVWSMINLELGRIPVRDVGDELVVQLSPTVIMPLSHLVWEAFHPEYRNMNYEIRYKDGNAHNCALYNIMESTGAK